MNGTVNHNGSPYLLMFGGLFFLLFFIGDATLNGLYNSQNIDKMVIVVTNTTIKDNTHLLSKMESDYITKNTNACINNDENIQSLLPSSRWDIVLNGLSDEEIEEISQKLTNKCLKEYVLAADTIEEMTNRNNQFAAIAPYSVNELASIASR